MEPTTDQEQIDRLLALAKTILTTNKEKNPPKDEIYIDVCGSIRTYKHGPMIGFLPAHIRVPMQGYHPTILYKQFL